MMVREGQVTPFHYHWHKMEDIINRGGGELVMRLRHVDGGVGGGKIAVSVDGILRELVPDEPLRLVPGESVCLEPEVFHTFHAKGGTVMVGEVSSVNDDSADNRFLEERSRFPEIEEDVPARFVLCSEYPAAVEQT